MGQGRRMGYALMLMSLQGQTRRIITHRSRRMCAERLVKQGKQNYQGGSVTVNSQASQKTNMIRSIIYAWCGHAFLGGCGGDNNPTSSNLGLIPIQTPGPVIGSSAFSSGSTAVFTADGATKALTPGRSGGRFRARSKLLNFSEYRGCGRSHVCCPDIGLADYNFTDKSGWYFRRSCSGSWFGIWVSSRARCRSFVSPQNRKFRPSTRKYQPALILAVQRV